MVLGISSGDVQDRRDAVQVQVQVQAQVLKNSSGEMSEER